MKRILYFNHISALGGSGCCLFQMVNALPKDEYEPIVVLPEEGALSDLFRHSGVAVIIDPRIRPLMGNSNSSGFWRWNNVRRYLTRRRGAGACYDICKDIKPDVVHLNCSVLFHFAKGAKQAGVESVILHVREHWALRPWDPRERLMRAHVPKYVDSIIAISETASARFGFGDRTVVVYDWPDLGSRSESAELIENFHISPRAKVILCPGGRSPIKGTLVALQAMEEVSEKSALLVVLGGISGNKGGIKGILIRVFRVFGIKTYGMRLDEAMDRLGCRVLALPVTDKMRDLILRSSIVVSPFTTAHFSMPSIEAGSLRRSVIVSDSGHSRETVQHGVTGLIVPPCDAGALARAIDLLLNNDEMRLRLGDAGFEYVEERFIKGRAVETLRRIYEAMDSQSSFMAAGLPGFPGQSKV